MSKKIILSSTVIILTFTLLICLNIKPSHSQPTLDIKFIEDIDGILTIFTTNENTPIKVSIYDKEENLVLEKETTNNKIPINELKPNNNEEFNIKISTIINDKKQILKETTYKSNKISFTENQSRIIKDTLNISIDGTIKEEHTLILTHNNHQIYKETINTNNIKILSNIFDGYKGRITAQLFNKNNILINEYNFYKDVPIVGNIDITTEDEISIPYDEFTINYVGGQNASNYVVTVYDGKKRLGSVDGTSTKATIPASLLKQNKTLKLEVKAITDNNEDLTTKDIIKVFVNQKKKASIVTLDKYYKNMKANTKLTLSSNTPNATIKYTTNNKDPYKYGKVYKEPITITKDIKLKAVAIKDNYYKSDTTTYDIKIGNKIPVIYLSPSNQYDNIGIGSVGYSSEMEMMTRISNYLKKYLEEAGFKVYINRPRDKMNIWLAESNRYKADLHFAIHSNASANHKTSGMEIYTDNESSMSNSIARLLYDNLYEIYPNKTSSTNRGLKYANGTLGEVNNKNTNCGVLIEVAFHDNKEDARWMVNNQKAIARNLASTIIDYYQMNGE